MRDGEPERSWPLLLAGVWFIAFGDLLESRLRTDVIYDCWQATTPCHALSLSLFSRWNNWAVALFFSRVGLPFVLHSSWLDALFHLLSYYSSFPLASFSFTERHHKKKREEEKRRKKTDAYLCSMRCRCAYRGPTTATFLVFSLFLAVLPKKKYSHREFPSSFFSGQQSVFFCLFAVALSAPIALRRVKIIRNESWQSWCGIGLQPDVGPCIIALYINSLIIIPDRIKFAVRP